MNAKPAPVLIVEDSVSVAELLRERIGECCGTQCAVARTLADAQALIAGTPLGFSVAVLDLNLPDAREGDVLDPIMDAGIPSIVLTGSEDEALRQSVLARGVSDYVKKDAVGVDYVARQIRRMLNADRYRILIVDDARSYREYLGGLLEQHGYLVTQAEDGEAGLQKLQHDDSIRMVITDYHMPRMNGLQMTAAMRRLKSFDQLGIIALSQSGAPDLLTRFLRGGASDFLHKSFSVEELFCRVDQNIDILISLAEARHASNHDYLTGLPNRRDFMRRATVLRDSALADATGVCVAVIDADHFKRLNDQYGHHMGDVALIELAQALRQAAGEHGLCARMGGEEFALLLARCTRERAAGVLETLRCAVSEVVLENATDPVSFTVSIGATIEPGKSLEDMLDRADAALYSAKSGGRDRVVFVS